jgi:hypothetical protein
MPITPLFAAQALAATGLRRLQRLQPERLSLIANLVERSRCVPLPGAYAARLHAIRERCASFGSMPSPARRAAVAIGLLGRTDAEGRFADHWNLRHWRPVVRQWFAAFSHDLPEASEPPAGDPALAMLAALYLLALGARPSRDDAQRLRDDLRRAADRLAQPYRAEIPLAMPAGFDPAACGTGTQWQTAAAALGASRRALVKSMYFLHAFHAALGCRQPDPDRLNKPAFERLYAPLHQRLRSAAAAACGLGGAAQSLAAGLPLLGPFSSVAPQPVSPLAETLPPCFRAWSPQSTTVPRAYVRELLEAAGASETLDDEHALAQAQVDALIDVLRIELRPDPASGQDATYLYLEGCARPKYGPSIHWSLFNRLGQGLLVGEVRALLGASQPAPADAAACSLCRQ